jgi:UDP-2,4-diacetamido-2,4,6-trideoxy-beta-L-altropyranose hydrolase
MRAIDIRADGGTDMGMGHIVRCIALAEMLREKFDVKFILQETDTNVFAYIESQGFQVTRIPRTKKFDTESTYIVDYLRQNSLVVLDGYHFKTDYQKAIKSAGHFLVAIDDLHQWDQLADIVINHGGYVDAGQYHCAPSTKLLLGYKYLLLRKEFYSSQKRESISSIQSITLSMGAADINNLTLRFAEWLLDHDKVSSINLLLSKINPHFATILERTQHEKKITIHLDLGATALIALIQSTDILICPASTISLEGCALGVFILTGTTASNQINNCNSLVEAGAALSLGDLNSCTKQKLLQGINSFCDDLPSAQKQLESQGKIVDRQTIHRIQSAFDQA